MIDPVILYVEDNRESREIMKLLLRDIMNIPDVMIFENSDNLIARIEALQPQPTIILLDIHVPPLSGFDMLKLLRAHDRYHDLPIIALTASVMNEEVNQLKQAGFNGVIAKPLDIDTFPARLELIINGQKLWDVLE